MTLKAHLHEAGRQFVIYALEQSEGNVPAAAKLLGVHRTTAYLLFRRYGIDPRAPQSAPGSRS